MTKGDKWAAMVEQLRHVGEDDEDPFDGISMLMCSSAPPGLIKQIQEREAVRSAEWLRREGQKGETECGSPATPDRRTTTMSIDSAAVTPATATVRAAIAATPPAYFAKTCASRAEHSPDRLGSYVLGMHADDVFYLLKGLEWEAYDHPDVQAPARAYRATEVVKGRFGMIQVEGLAADRPVLLTDPKVTGKVEGAIFSLSGLTPTDELTLLVGPGDEGKDIVWTFFPGPPVKPSQLDAEGRDGTTITVAEAKALGLTWLKVVLPPIPRAP